MNNRQKFFTGNANRALAEKICFDANTHLDEAEITRFSDGETRVKIKENLRTCDVFIIQPTCGASGFLDYRIENLFNNLLTLIPKKNLRSATELLKQIIRYVSVNDHLMELLLLIDACKRSSARHITAVIPYFGYGRQDKKDEPRVPISAKLVAKMIETAGTDRIIFMDLHDIHIQGYFDIPSDNILAMPVFIEEVIGKRFKDQGKNLIIGTPDVGGAKRAREYAESCGNLDFIVVDKRRSGPNKVQSVTLVGSVKDKLVILVDDMVDTAGSLKIVSKTIMDAGAKEVHAICTHPVLSGDAVKNIIESDIVTMTVADTIPLRQEALKSPKFKVVSMSKILSQAITNSISGESVTSLFKTKNPFL